MIHRTTYLPLLLIVVCSTNFLCTISYAFSPSSGVSPSKPTVSSFRRRRHASSVMLKSTRTNQTTMVETVNQNKRSYVLDKAMFLEALNRQLPDLEQLRDQTTTTRTTATGASNYMVNQEENMIVGGVANALQQREEEVDERAHGELWTARLLLIGAAALYGTNFSLVKVLGDTLPVGVSSTMRFALAVLATSPWLVKDLNKEGALTAAWLGFEVGLWNSIGYVSQAIGLETTPASESAFICSLAVVTVPIIEFLTGKRLKSREWIGAILAVVGVAFLELGGDLSMESMDVGNLLSLVQPFAFGIGFWKMEKAMNRFPEEASRMTAAQLLAIMLASASYGLWAIDGPTLQSYPWSDWLTDPSLMFSLFWTGVITTALTIYMENKAMQTLSAAETTLIFSTEPLWGTAFAAVVMNEQLGFNVGVGATFILTACIYSSLGINGLNNLVQSLWANVETKLSPFRGGLPMALQKQWAWWTSGAVTSWAAGRVAAAMPVLEDMGETVEEMALNFTEKLL